MINLSGSNYLYLEQIFIVRKMLEPFMFDCTFRVENC